MKKKFVVDLDSSYVLKITLQEIEPPIWRRLLVPARTTLHQLHCLIQHSMGWTNSHLHAFEVAGRHYGWADEDCNIRSQNGIKLADALGSLVTEFVYEYDFGDSWYHDIVVESIRPPSAEPVKAVCLAGARSCPPEDCGGVSGYMELLKIVRNRRHREHKDMMTWLGGSFDPEAFDLAAINRHLRPKPITLEDLRGTRYNP